MWEGLNLLQGEMVSLAQVVAPSETACKAIDPVIEAKVTATLATANIHTDHELVTLSSGLKEVAEFVNLFHQELSLLSSGFSGHPNPSMETQLRADIQDTKNKNDSIERSTILLGHSLHSGSHPGMAALKIQLRLLEDRIPTHSVTKLGGQNFQSRSEVMLFVERKVPSNTFAAFHDRVTLLESLTDMYSVRKDVLAEWYQSTKVGITEPEARHVASFKLTLPTMFGSIKEGAAPNTKHFLLVVKRFNDWNFFDNISRYKTLH
jgi:hypothetical protein